MLKKIILGVLIISPLVFSSCGNDDDDISKRSCETLEQDAADALAFYNQEYTLENCISYRALLQAQLNKNCLSSEGEVFVQKIINTLNCN